MTTEQPTDKQPGRLPIVVRAGDLQGSEPSIGVRGDQSCSGGRQLGGYFNVAEARPVYFATQATGQGQRIDISAGTMAARAGTR